MPQQVDLIRRFAEEAFAGRSLVAQMIMGRLTSSIGILRYEDKLRPFRFDPSFRQLAAFACICINLLLRLRMLGDP